MKKINQLQAYYTGKCFHTIDRLTLTTLDGYYRRQLKQIVNLQERERVSDIQLVSRSKMGNLAYLVTTKAKRIKVYTDSQLLCRQIKKEYKVKNQNLLNLYLQAEHLFSIFDSAEIEHIGREKNQGADKLAKKAAKSKV